MPRNNLREEKGFQNRAERNRREAEVTSVAQYCVGGKNDRLPCFGIVNMPVIYSHRCHNFNTKSALASTRKCRAKAALPLNNRSREPHRTRRAYASTPSKDLRKSPGCNELENSFFIITIIIKKICSSSVSIIINSIIGGLYFIFILASSTTVWYFVVVVVLTSLITMNDDYYW